jgi:cobaltochelatase CobN
LIFAIVLAVFCGASGASLEGSGGNVSLIVIDSDSYAAQLALSSISLPDGFRARAFCLSDLSRDDAAAFVRESGIILADVMEDKLSNYVMEHGLLEGRAVYALRESADDGPLAEAGFIFNDELEEYYSHLDIANIQNMIKRAVNLAMDDSIAYEPVKATPMSGLYHPDASGASGDVRVFSGTADYLRWYESRDDYDPDRPRLGIMFFSTSLVPGQREAFDELIAKMEDKGFNILPAFGPDRTVLDSYFMDERRDAAVDAVLSFSLKFYMSLDDGLRASVSAMDVPIFNAINMYSAPIEEWESSPEGIPAMDVIWTIATPEITGAIEPTPLIGKVEERLPNGGSAYRYELIPGMAERIAPRIRNWVKLRKTQNKDKRVAILYYNNSQGKQNIGASYLNVFRSLERITETMKEAGYGIPRGLALDEERIKGLVLRGGRNIGSWAPGELDALIASGSALQLPIAEYKKWFAELPEDFRRRVTEQWGEPETSDLMIKDGRIIIPLVEAGNVVMLPEPARGITDDPIKLYHDPTLYPHHQYIAVYLWLKHGWGADAMVHLGTHATYEWLPGKGAGLSVSCPPEVMITDIPNVYPYIVDDVGEGLQAKRRGRGVAVDHLTPALARAEGYGEYVELREICEQYEQAVSLGSDTAAIYLGRARDLALRLGLNDDLGLSGIAGRDEMTAIAQYLEYLDMGYVPYGMHTFGSSPKGEALSATARAIIEQNPELSEGSIRKSLAESGPSETASFLNALDGRYVPSAEGNDPVRNPKSIPTGKNFYGISPNRMPTTAAWKLGREAADQIIAKHMEENGTYPEKVAVVLWAVESLRNEGLSESTIMSLIGVEPMWNAAGRVTGTRPIPGARLGRPRVDVAINASGLYRDLFPDKILLIDAAIRQAAAQDDIENFIRRNDLRMERLLIDAGVASADAGRFSRARIFSEAPGAYGNRVEELVSASGLWEDDSDVAGVYLKHTGYAYGGEMWGAPAERALDMNLRDASAVWHSASSSYFGLMDNDDMFMYLGGMSLAIRELSGRSPQTLIADQRTLGEVKMESLGKFLGAEMRARYLNPKWAEGMKGEGYAGAREMSNYVEYLWGWQVTTPESVSEASWNETYEVYVEDKYDMGIPEFLDRENPWAYQSLTGRMLEAARKGYWNASDEIKRELAANYAMSVINRGIACCDHTCNNLRFHQMVLNIISIPGLMSPELTAEFKLAVETAGQKPLDEMASTRAEMIKNLGAARPNYAPRPMNDGHEAQNDAESVKGFKMEPVENAPDETSVSSSGVEWFAGLFVLCLLALFFAGLRRGKRSV